MDMSVGFETKQLATETLGEYLKRVRIALQLTLVEVSKKTGIFENFLVQLEAGKYEKLPPDVYVLGFLKKLSTAYAIPLSPLQEQYRKERDILEHRSRHRIDSTRTIRDTLKDVSFTPKTITIAGVVTVILVAVVYIVIQIFSINRTPHLVILEPQPDSVINTSSVMVKGNTDFGSILTINSQNVFVKNDGSFQTLAGISPGQAELRVEAVNKFGKRSTKILSLRVEAPSSNTNQETVSKGIQLNLRFVRPTTIALIKDGVQIPSETIPAGATKNILAQDSIILTTSDAGSTEVTFNGSTLGLLGQPGETMTVPFTATATMIVPQ